MFGSEKEIYELLKEELNFIDRIVLRITYPMYGKRWVKQKYLPKKMREMMEYIDFGVMVD